MSGELGPAWYRAMRERPDIPDAVRAAIRDLRGISGAETVYLFGSRARGDHREDSDWDLALILPDDAERRDL